MSLEAKIIQTKFLIREAVNTFGEEKCYISFSGGRDSTVLSHIAKQLYPNILHLFANTTNEYPETLKHIQWEKIKNNTNIITVLPIDANGAVWTFKNVVEKYGYPMFSKRIANAISMPKPNKQDKIQLTIYGEILRNMINIKNYLYLISAVKNSKKNRFVAKQNN